MDQFQEDGKALVGFQPFLLQLLDGAGLQFRQLADGHLDLGVAGKGPSSDVLHVFGLHAPAALLAPLSGRGTSPHTSPRASDTEDDARSSRQRFLADVQHSLRLTLFSWTATGAK